MASVSNKTVMPLFHLLKNKLMKHLWKIKAISKDLDTPLYTIINTSAKQQELHAFQ